MAKKIQVALLGAGTVGAGVYKLLHRRAGVMEKTISSPLTFLYFFVRLKNAAV